MRLFVARKTRPWAEEDLTHRIQITTTDRVMTQTYRTSLTGSTGSSISGHLYVLTPRGVLNIGWRHCMTIYEREHLRLQTPQGVLPTPLEDIHNRRLRCHFCGCTGSLHITETITIVRGSKACVPILLIQKDSFSLAILYTRRLGQAGLPSKDRNTPRGHLAS